MSYDGKKILVAIIAYNEEKNLPRAIEDVKTHLPEADIVVVDDCSSDGTAKTAAGMGVRVIRHAVNMGNLGFAAVKTSFIYAHKHGYDIYCQFDGDAQHDGAYLKAIIGPVADNKADLVIGSRFLNNEGYQSTLPRRIGIRLFSIITSYVIGQRVFDVSSGFKAYGKKAIELFAVKYPYPIADTNEMLIVTRYAGGIIKEVPVQMRAREHGKSIFTFYKAFVFPIQFVTYILGLVLQRHLYKNMIK